MKLKIYNVVCEDHNQEPTAIPFIDLEKAKEYVRKEAKGCSGKYPEDYKEKTPPKNSKWLMWVEYSCEGDCFWITEHTIETEQVTVRFKK